ncbi:hypothetical protein T265_12861, partial [Opisthorchis viverrini]
LSRTTASTSSKNLLTSIRVEPITDGLATEKSEFQRNDNATKLVEHEQTILYSPIQVTASSLSSSSSSIHRPKLGQSPPQIRAYVEEADQYWFERQHVDCLKENVARRKVTPRPPWKPPALKASFLSYQTTQSHLTNPQKPIARKAQAYLDRTPRRSGFNGRRIASSSSLAVLHDTKLQNGEAHLRRCSAARQVQARALLEQELQLAQSYKHRPQRNTPSRTQNTVGQSDPNFIQFLTTDASEAWLVVDGVSVSVTRRLENGYLVVLQAPQSGKTSSIGHVLRMPKHRLPRRVLFSVPPSGWRKPLGGQHMTWQKNVEEIMKSLGVVGVVRLPVKVQQESNWNPTSAVNTCKIWSPEIHYPTPPVKISSHEEIYPLRYVFYVEDKPNCVRAFANGKKVSMIARDTHCRVYFHAQYRRFVPFGQSPNSAEQNSVAEPTLYYQGKRVRPVTVAARNITELRRFLEILDVHYPEFGASAFLADQLILADSAHDKTKHV